MDNLFFLYRYLTNSQHQLNEDNAYNVAHRTLEPVLELLASLDVWGQTIRDNGGIEWEQAEMITSRIIEAHRSALCVHAGNSVDAIKDFAESDINLTEIDGLINLLQQQKAKMLKFKQLSDELFEADDHPF